MPQLVLCVLRHEPLREVIQPLLFSLGAPAFRIVTSSASLEALLSSVQCSFDASAGEESSVHFLWIEDTSSVSKVKAIQAARTYEDACLRAQGITELHSHDTVRFLLHAQM